MTTLFCSWEEEGNGIEHMGTISPQHEAVAIVFFSEFYFHVKVQCDAPASRAAVVYRLRLVSAEGSRQHPNYQ
uniref:Uncharacterized protein n=1 Tax=Caenorhabditis japonica TaxID=281687 RepID=A0A8R1EN63_CAEJA